MKTLTPQQELWIDRGMVVGHWLNKQFDALAHLGYRGFRQRIYDRSGRQFTAH